MRAPSKKVPPPDEDDDVDDLTKEIVVEVPLEASDMNEPLKEARQDIVDGTPLPTQTVLVDEKEKEKVTNSGDAATATTIGSPSEDAPGDAGTVEETADKVHAQATLDNSNLRQMFPEDGSGITGVDYILMFVCVGPISLFILMSYSAIFGMGYSVYGGLQNNGYNIAMGMFGLAMLIAFCLHVLNFYRWNNGCRIAAASAFVLYLWFIGLTCYAKAYPALPVIVASMQYPISLTLVRYKRGGITRARDFYKGLSFVFGITGGAILMVFIVWLIASDMMWGDTTKATLHEKMREAKVYEAYDLDEWSSCERGRELVKIDGWATINGFSVDQVAEINQKLGYCSRIELTAFTIWSCPLAQSILLLCLSKFCVIRLWIMGQDGAERTLKMIMVVAGCMAACFWMTTAAAGSSMGLANAVMMGLGIWGILFGVFLIFVVDLKAVMEKASSSTIAKTAVPVLKGEPFAGFMTWIMGPCVLGFLCFEVVVRQLQKCVGVNKTEHRWLTPAGQKVTGFISTKHFALTLEWAFKIGFAYMFFKLFTIGTPVFLAKLGEELATMEFPVVCGIFFVVGWIMFLLPPVPGVPVYMASGTIIVPRAKLDDWNFYVAVLFSSCFCLVLKLCAVCCQQKGFGEGLGRWNSVKMAVGVHTATIRAIEKILKRPGMRVEKVCILCGGPDWPTSVLTGILKLSLPQMLLGTLPCFFLIAPCVLAGASLTDKDLKSFSPMIALVAAVTQGGMGVMAMGYVAREQERSAEELSQPVPEHAILIEKSEEATLRSNKYRLETAWKKFKFIQKFLLLAAVICMSMTCYVAGGLGSQCFRKFELGNAVDDPFPDGLDGKVSNLLVEPLGYCAMAGMLVGLVLYCAYNLVNKTFLHKIPDKE